MKLLRRKFLHLAAAAAALPAIPRVASALDYPTRPVHIVVGLAPSGPNDLCARLIGAWLSERLGQSFIVDNRPGAATNLAAEFVVRAPPDGYTLLMIATSATVNATLYQNLNFNIIRDIAPIAGIMRAPNVLVVNPAFPAKTLAEFIAYAKANPHKINIGTPGTGTGPHMYAELLQRMAGVDLVEVAYRGSGPVLVDLLAGQVDAYFDAGSALEYVRAGKLRPLAVTSATRSPALPDVPTVGEFVPGFEATSWFGVGAPKLTPVEIVDKLNHEINAGLADPKIAQRIADLGGEPMALSPAEFAKLIADDTEKWAKVIKAANIKGE
jgi:tripartite-type tricarboxylate transporter receptor subunit TctC